MPKKSAVTVVTDRGQISIPADLRRDLDLRPGRHMRWERHGDRELRLVVVADELPRGAKAMLGFARRFRETRSTADWMRELREGEQE